MAGAWMFETALETEQGALVLPVIITYNMSGLLPTDLEFVGVSG